jgi:hypothetical protein
MINGRYTENHSDVVWIGGRLENHSNASLCGTSLDFLKISQKHGMKEEQNNEAVAQVNPTREVDLNYRIIPQNVVRCI